MKTRRDHNGTYIVGLERGDSLRGSVESLAKTRGIACARLSAIGAVEDPELGYYDLGKREYLRKTHGGIWELVSLQGNVTMKDGEPFMHAHVAIGGRDYGMRGGHLFDAKVGVTVELFLQPFSTPLDRAFNDDVGLHCWRVDDGFR